VRGATAHYFKRSVNQSNQSVSQSFSQKLVIVRGLQAALRRSDLANRDTKVNKLDEEYKETTCIINV